MKSCSKPEHIGLRGPNGVALLDDVSLEVHAGEIVCVAGVSGNGQTELLEVLSGVRPLTSGRMLVCGQEVTATHPAGAQADAGAGRRPCPGRPASLRHDQRLHRQRNRHHGLSSQEALQLRGLLDYGAAARHCSALMERYDVRPRRPAQIAVNFSGGNQQKLVMAREAVVEPRLLLVGQPTRGVDIGAIEFIHRQLIGLREAGCGLLVVSVELDEVMSLADRILVMYGGRIVGEVPGAEADERTLGLMMANVWKQAGAA